MTEYDDFSRNMEILFEEIRKTAEICLNQHDGKKLKKLIQEIVNAHNLLNGLRQELYNKAIGQDDVKERKNTLKAADYVHKVQERLKKILEKMRPYLPIFVREEEEEKPPEEDEEARKRWDRFLKAKGKLKEALDAAKGEDVPEEELKDANAVLKVAEKIEKDKEPIHDQAIDTIEELSKHVHRIIEEKGKSKKKHEEEKTKILDRIEELRENVKKVGLDKETQGKVDEAEEWLGRASPDDYEKIEQHLNRITESVERVKSINRELEGKIKGVEDILPVIVDETRKKEVKEKLTEAKEKLKRGTFEEKRNSLLTINDIIKDLRGIEEEKHVDEKLEELFKKAKEVNVPEDDIKRIRDIVEAEDVTLGDKKDSVRNLTSFIEFYSGGPEKEQLKNALDRRIRKLREILPKLKDPEDKSTAQLAISMLTEHKKAIETSKFDAKEINNEIEQTDKEIRKFEGKIKKKEKLERAEAPEEIPKHIVDLFREFRRNLGDAERGVYHYILEVRKNCFAENIPGYKSLPEEKIKNLREMYKAANFFIEIYKTILPKMLNEKAFYEMLIYLSNLGRRKVIWVSWFHYLPRAIKGIREAKDNLNKERAENAKIKDVNKDLIKHYDYVIDELLGTTTMKLLDVLDEIYHKIITEVEHLSPEK